MKTIQINLYEFSELSDEAKERAIENYRKINDEIHSAHEIFDSLMAVFKAARITVLDYSLGLYNSRLRIYIDEATGELTGKRAFAWLENNLFSDLRITRYDYLKNRKDYFRYGYRIGAIKGCPLTGVCYDEYFLDKLKESVKDGMNLRDAFSSLADDYQHLLESEWEYQNSEEYISEILSDSRYKFTENGEIY